MAQSTDAPFRVLNDLWTISRCQLYRKLRQHSFCNDCKEKRGRPGERNFCSVCRAFFASNFGGIRRKHFLNKLAELHRIQLKGWDRLVGVKTIGKFRSIITKYNTNIIHTFYLALFTGYPTCWIPRQETDVWYRLDRIHGSLKFFPDLIKQQCAVKSVQLLDWCKCISSWKYRKWKSCLHDNMGKF